jgi:hypothetical protein
MSEWLHVVVVVVVVAVFASATDSHESVSSPSRVRTLHNTSFVPRTRLVSRRFLPPHTLIPPKQV